MSGSRLPAIREVAILLLLIGPTCMAQAQSLEDCLGAPVNQATRVCQLVIDNGDADASVYWKMSAAQYQIGQPELANRTLDKALELYPGNSRLESLKEIITVDSTEQAMNSRSARLNQHSSDKGAMKISCLTRTGEIGISACKRRLELTDQDGDRIRARLRQLEQIQETNRLAVTPPASSAVNTANPVVVSIETPEPEPFTESSDDTAPSGAESNDAVAGVDDLRQQIVQARRDAYKALVTEVQRRLNDFGFNAGFPDGVPGRNTRRALTDFYEVTGIPASTSITDLTLEDLESEQRKLEQSTRLLDESRSLLTNGDTERARNRLQQARETSTLVTIPAELEQSLNPIEVPNTSVPDSVASPAPESMDIGTAVDTPAADNITTDNTNDTDSAAKLSELRRKINHLHGQIRRQQADRVEQLEAVRDAL